MTKVLKAFDITLANAYEGISKDTVFAVGYRVEDPFINFYGDDKEVCASYRVDTVLSIKKGDTVLVEVPRVTGNAVLGGGLNRNLWYSDNNNKLVAPANSVTTSQRDSFAMTNINGNIPTTVGGITELDKKLMSLSEEWPPFPAN